MKTLIRRSGAVLLLVLAGFAAPVRAGTMFSNLVQPGDQFGPDSVGVGQIPVPGVFVYDATNFTPAFDGRLTGIEVPVGLVSGPGDIDVALLADSGNLPGAILETFPLTGLPSPSPTALIFIPSISHPVLSSGTQYWVSVTGGTPVTFAFWGLTVFNGDPTAGGASRAIQNGVDLGWTRGAGTRVGALLVSGDPVPEPAVPLLIGSAIVALFAMRTRSR